METVGLTCWLKAGGPSCEQNASGLCGHFIPHFSGESLHIRKQISEPPAELMSACPSFRYVLFCLSWSLMPNL